MDDTYVGKLLLDAGALNELDVNRVLARQREKNLRFGEAAEQLGLVSHEDIQRALSRQFEYPYVKPGESALSRTLVAAYQPFGPAAEALRALRSRISLLWLSDENRVLVVTGPRERAGCSSLAANLAIVFAQLGQKTLLIDANFRRPVQQALFGLETTAGLSGLLLGRNAFNDACTPVPAFEQLAVICAGAEPPNPQELLARVTFNYLLEAATTKFDVVIVDVPPVLEFADAQMVAARGGACVLSTCRHRTRLADVERSTAQLQSIGALVLGAVVNG
jgi:chain length determinant protein tyrosine kinase EpsG